MTLNSQHNKDHSVRLMGADLDFTLNAYDTGDLPFIWDDISTEVLVIVDETGVRHNNAKCRPLTGSQWIFYDDIEGYSLRPIEDVSNQWTIPIKKYRTAVLDKNGHINDF